MSNLKKTSEDQTDFLAVAEIVLKDNDRGDVVIFIDPEAYYSIACEIEVEMGETVWTVSPQRYTSLADAMDALANQIKRQVANDFYYDG